MEGGKVWRGEARLSEWALEGWSKWKNEGGREGRREGMYR